MSPVMRDCRSNRQRELLPLHSCRGALGRRKRRGPRVHPKLCARCSHLKRCCSSLTNASDYTPEGAYRSNRWLWCISVSVRRSSCPSCARPVGLLIRTLFGLPHTWVPKWRGPRAGNATLFGVKYTGSLTRRLFSSETVCSPGQRLKSARSSLAASFFPTVRSL